MKTVLLVDDLEQNQYLLRTILEAEGWSVLEAGTGKEALAMAHRQPPGLVISDILMPGMDGYALCRKWKAAEELKGVPFVFCSATFTDDLDEKLARELGADDFIRQPVDADDLIQRIRAVEKRPARAPSPAIRQAAGADQESEKTYSAVLARKLDQKVSQYRQIISELETSRSELDKRVKELTCLHTIGGLALDSDVSLETLCREAANELVSAVSSTANPVAIRVRFGDHDYCSPEATGSSPPIATITCGSPNRVEVFNLGTEASRALSDDDRLLIESVANRLHAEFAHRDEERQLAAANSRLSLLQAALEAASHSVVITNTQGAIEWVNPAFLKTTGYESAEVLGQNPRVLKSGKQEAGFYRKLWDTITAGNVWHGDFVNRRKDGSFYDEEASITPVKDAAGKITHYVAIKQDVTDQHELERRVLQSQRMESIGLLAGGVAHDLNNVLAPIMMAIEMLEGELSREERKELVDTVRTSGERGAGIIRQVLTFARGVEGERVVLQARHLIKDMVKIGKETFPKNIRIAMDISSSLWPVEADAIQLHQVLLNLAVNARDAMPEGGTLTFAAENVTLTEPRTFLNESVAPGRYIRLQTTDTGMGIPADKLGRIFEPFFTSKAHGQGTGLGLPTTLGIVRSHGGLIEVSSKPGAGSVFTVLLPAAETDVALAAPASGSVPRGNNETILLVDDEAPVRLVTRKILTLYGYQVIEAANGAEAVAEYAQHREQIALVVTDIVMPIMDGVALVRALRSINPEVRVLGASGFVGDQGGSNRMAELEAAGVALVIEKPFTAETLIRAIAEQLAA